MTSYSAEAASREVTAMFPEASRTTGALWKTVTAERPNAKM
ncbi:MAG: hypothetical protein ABSG92_03740 [Conexivisphaerales archaeon]